MIRLETLGRLYPTRQASFCPILYSNTWPSRPVEDHAKRRCIIVAILAGMIIWFARETTYPPMNDNDRDRERFNLLPPDDMPAELETRAAKRGCTTQKLIDEAWKRLMAKPEPAFNALLLKVEAMEDALLSGEKPSWPDSFDECLEVGIVLSGRIKVGWGDFLLKASGEQMDAIEPFCQQKGISYEEFVRQALYHHLEKADDKTDEPDEGKADWWKK